MKQKIKMEFSKFLAVIITMLFVFCILFSLAVWFKQNRIPGEILSYVAAPFSIVISGYFVKSGVENYKKITQSSECSQVYNNEKY
jgi:hypothetical protein